MPPSTDSSNDLLPPQLQKLMPYYALILAVVIFYSGVYDNAFLYDDKYLILKNTYLQSWHSLGAIFQTYVNSGAFRTGHFYRPLQNVLYLILYQIAGPSTFAFHLLNVSLHATNACLVFMLGMRLGFKPWAVFLSTLIWALHPLQTEAVTYMSGTADTLYTFFCLFGVVIVLPDFTPQKIFMAVPIAILGLLSKETAIILPLLVMSCIYLLSDKRLDPRTYIKTWPLWCVTLGYLVLRFLFLPFSGKDLLNIDPMSQIYATHMSLRIYTFLATIPAYLQLMVWPSGLHMDRNFPVRLDPWFPEIYLGLAILLASAACLMWTRNTSRPAFSWGLLWFALAHFPQTGIIIPVNSLFLEHWMYLPSIGLALGMGEACAQLPPLYARISAYGAFGIALVLGYCTYLQNDIWHDPIVFYKNILDRGETSERAYNNLGISYMDKGDYVDALAQFHTTLKDHDLTPETHQNIAAVLSKNYDGQTHVPEEIDELNKALAINPNFMPAYEALAQIYTFQGDTQKARFYQQKAEAIRKTFQPQ